MLYSVLYALRDAWRATWARPFTTLGTALLVTIAVASSATATATGMAVSQWSQQLTGLVSLRAFLADGAAPNEVAAAVAKLPDVRDVKVVGKDEEAKHLADILPDHGQALAAFPANPLPNSLEIHVTRPELVPQVALAVKGVSGVTDVVNPQSYLDKLLDFARTLRRIAALASIIFGLAALVACTSAISLGLARRRLEIRLRRLLGASAIVVALHFALEGALLALLGSLVGAYAFLTLLNGLLGALSHVAFLTRPLLPLSTLALTAAVGGVAAGALAGLVAVPTAWLGREAE